MQIAAEMLQVLHGVFEVFQCMADITQRMLKIFIAATLVIFGMLAIGSGVFTVDIFQHIFERVFEVGDEVFEILDEMLAIVAGMLQIGLRMGIIPLRVLIILNGVIQQGFQFAVRILGFEEGFDRFLTHEMGFWVLGGLVLREEMGSRPDGDECHQSEADEDRSEFRGGL